MRSFSGLEGNGPAGRNIVAALNCSSVGSRVIDLNCAGAWKAQRDDNGGIARPNVSFERVGATDAEAGYGCHGRVVTERTIECRRGSFAVLLKINGKAGDGSVGIEREVRNQKAASVGVAPAAVAADVNPRSGRRSKSGSLSAFIFGVTELLSCWSTELKRPEMAVRRSMETDRDGV